MNTAQKNQNIIRITLAVLILVIPVLIAIIFSMSLKINKMQEQIDKQNEFIHYILGENTDLEYVTITFVDTDGTETEYKSYLDLEMSIMDVLLSNGLTQNEFTTFDNENYYFDGALTDVLELKGESSYYEENEWGGTLIVGLNKIKADQDLTVVKTNW